MKIFLNVWGLANFKKDTIGVYGRQGEETESLKMSDLDLGEVFA